MKILVTGATGFIGHNLIPLLLQAGHFVTVVVRDSNKVKAFAWTNDVRMIVADIHKLELNWLDKVDQQDALIHLAWPGLPNYKALFHFEDTLLADCLFLKTMIEKGVKQLLVTGTCFEYGMQSGCLKESQQAMPNNSYALAKDSQRKYLQLLQQEYSFVLQWTRLFYMYGEGQSPHTLLGQLKIAIDTDANQFNMSGGEQLRDYLSVEKVAEYLLEIIECRNCDGIVNVCSGQPISIRSLVEKYLDQHQAKMKLNLGFYPYADYEPMAFWGNSQKLHHWLKTGKNLEK